MRPLLSSLLRVLLGVVFVALAAQDAEAFCGFYVNTGGGPLVADASRVVLMRVGMRTVLSIQNDYKGPPESFALIVPVPVVLEQKNVRTLPASVFDRIDRLSSPRLVEYWEQDPCPFGGDNADNKEGGTGARAKGEEGSMGSPNRPLVKVEAEFSVDEYDIVVLSALDSGALDAWLREHHYMIPPGAEPLLRPYVQDGSKFFVAKVDTSRVRFNWGRASLSPLRFFYDTPTFSLPTRLGLINSGGVQDLIVHILGADRYETANYENLTIPTNLPVKDEVRTEFPAFYAALFDQTVKGHPRAVVTEYAWSPQSCDPCPAGAGPLTEEDSALFGGDVIETKPQTMVLTRLHARYGKDSAGDDLVFKIAPPIVGGRETPDEHGVLPRTAVASSSSSFQGRYIIRHAWTGAITCSSPHFGMWGPNPEMSPPPPPMLKSSVRRDLDIRTLVLDDDKASNIAHGGGGRSPLAGIWRRITPDLESTSSRRTASLWLLPIGLVAVAIVAWRRRRGVLRSSALYALCVAIALGVGIFGSTRSAYDQRALGQELAEILSVLGVVLGAAILAIVRAPARDRRARGVALLAFAGLVPVLSSFVECLRGVRAAEQTTAGMTGIDAALASRLASEVAGEALEPIVGGCLHSGVLLLVAAYFASRGFDSETAGAKKTGGGIHVALTLALALAARFVVRQHFGPFDVIALFGFTASALVIRRTMAGERRGGALAVGLAAISAVLLLDIAGRFHPIAGALQAIAGESVDPEQRVRILQRAVDEETQRRLLTAADAFLGTALLVARARASERGIDSRAWLGQGWGLAASVALAASVLAALTPLSWSGRSAAIEALGASMSHLSWQKGTVLAKSSVEQTTELAGPALLVDSSHALYGTPGPGITPQPYGPSLFDVMAQAGVATSGAPLLVAPKEMALGGLLGALAPLLASRQYDYRLLLGSGGVDSRVGAYAPLLIASNQPPMELELRADLVITRATPSGSSHRCVGLIPDGDTFRLVPLALEKDGYSVDHFFTPQTLSYGGRALLFDAIHDASAKAKGTPVLFFAPDVSIETVMRATTFMGQFHVNGSQSSKLFPRVIVSTSRAAAERALATP